jgi:hypothetical protein
MNQEEMKFYESNDMKLIKKWHQFQGVIMGVEIME